MNYSEYISYLPLAEDLQAEFTDKWQNFTYQCRGRRYNYTTENIVDSDLLGIGVTITFVITAIATFAIIIYGFYRGLIVDKFQNPIDKALLKWLGTKRPIGDAQWKREKVAFHSAVSALGDQQLVICFAILIAGLANCELSVYGLQNLLAVAWLGLVAHMLTLVVTSPDAKNNRVTSFFRRFMMLCMICLFKFTSSFYVYTYYASAWMFAFSQYFSERNLSGDELLEHDIVTQQSMDGLAQAMPTYSAHFLLGRALLLFKPAPTMRQGFEWDALNVQTIAYCCAFREFLSGPLVVKDPITLPGRTFAGPDGISAPSHIGNASHSSAPAPPLGAVHSDLHIDSTKGTYDIDIEEQR
ncbi:hypothetical protein BJ508DRAFT_336312 [Ascobolus immersus RN42]|uniref:Uncharacterized protein n=1 Tax=Ascobolus immersus RN42 TaxID=1160509 RepID=A0A3N4HNF4_ASCIM|nr:hypothetical protein BJ508DRAFT_336312 [Ascobolus immersus RN42]